MAGWKSFTEWIGLSKPPKRELDKSQYSLVSCGELTTDNIQLWLALPDEVKNDPSLASLRQMYERDGAVEATPLATKSGNPIKVLSLVDPSPTAVGDTEVCSAKKDSNETPTITEIKGADNVPTNEHKKTEKKTKPAYYIKMTVLLACWIFFTVIFLTYDVKKETRGVASVAPDEVKTMTSASLETSRPHSILIRVSGPFLAENDEIKLNDTIKERTKSVTMWLESSRTNATNLKEKSENWTIYLDEDDTLPDFGGAETRSAILKLTPGISANGNCSLKIVTTSRAFVAFSVAYKLDPVDENVGVIYACVLLVGLYVLIIFEIINRTLAAVTMSTMSLAALALAGDRPALSEVITWLNEETLILLFSMMLLVAIMAETGIFDFLAVFTFQVTKGKLWPLILLLCAITATVSSILDNVTTILLMSPITIRLCEVMELDPVPILMFMAIFSNIGGTATPVGDPPNVIVASNRAVIDSGINFANFTAHMALGIILVFCQTAMQIRYVFRDSNKLRLTVPKEIRGLSHQISIWRRAADSLPHLSKDVQVVRERLERKIRKLTVELDVLIKKSNSRACPEETFQTTLKEMKEKYKIRDKALLIKASVAVCFVVVVFFLHSMPALDRVSLGWTALLGAILLLILADREDLEPVLHRVEWSTLLFFAALFVLMEALSKLGLISYIGGIMELLILRVDESSRLAVAILLTLWVSGVISAFVDNIPLTTMMVRVVVSMGSNLKLDLPMQPLIWALLFGVCLGGNGTLIGASANVVCAGVAEQHGYKFTFARFFRVGFPLMIGHFVVASIYLLMCHCVFSWH